MAVDIVDNFFCTNFDAGFIHRSTVVIHNSIFCYLADT